MIYLNMLVEYLIALGDHHLGEIFQANFPYLFYQPKMFWEPLNTSQI